MPEQSGSGHTLPAPAPRYGPQASPAPYAAARPKSGRPLLLVILVLIVLIALAVVAWQAGIV
jgi:hypothetical protein